MTRPSGTRDRVRRRETDSALRGEKVDALRRSDEIFQHLTDNITDAFWIRSPDMREVHFVSPAFEKIWGRTVGSLYADPHEWSDFTVPEDRERVVSAFAGLMRDTASLDIEYRIVRPGGEIRWVRVRGFQVRDAAGGLIRLTGIVTDITDTRRAAEALRDSMDEVSRSNRALMLLSACSAAVIRAEQEQALLDEVCRIGVEIGGYHTVRVGYAGDDQAGSITPMAHAGVDDERGDSDVIRLPLRDAHRTFGFLALSSAGTSETSAQELTLLQNMADNLAFGIGNLRVRFERERFLAAVVTVAAGVSASAGTEFFEQLAQNMAQALGAHGAFVACLLTGEPLTGRTIAAVVDGTVVDNFEYPLAGTPCEELLTSETSVVASHVTERYPDAPMLAALGAQGYVGRRLNSSSGQTLGTLFVIFREPLKAGEFVASTLQIFAARAASELERQQTDVQVREQAALLDIAREAIQVLDLEGRIILWNKGAERTYGWTAAEALGRLSIELLHTQPASFLEAHAALLEKGEWQGDMIKRARDGRHLTMEVRWTLVRDAQGKPKSILAINTDVTEKKLLESRFLRAQRMESIGTLAGGIAHDLNNVLTPILMSVETLRDVARNDEDHAVLATLEGSAQRGADLVKQVLTFARGVEGQRITVNPLHLMRDLLKVMLDTFPKTIDVRFTPARDLWTVTGDPTQMHQVLLNLCVNARDAMPRGGSLTVRMENIVLTDADTGVNVESHPGAYVMVTVDDTGDGIPPDIRDRIFEPFFTTKDIGKGTGLGLSTTMAIVKSHGGFITLYSEVRRGTTFRVYLPANTAVIAADGGLPGQTRHPRGNGEMVLVVDDEEAIRKIARRTLERFGYRVLTAGNGAEAVAVYTERGPEIAIVMTDMAMPVMDGPATIRALKAMNPDVKVVASSGYASGGGGTQARDAGAQYFVAKPYTAETLLSALHLALHEPETP